MIYVGERKVDVRMNEDLYFEEGFKAHQRSAIKAARELRYDEKVVKKIQEAETIDQISRIMTDARHAQIEAEREGSFTYEKPKKARPDNK